MGSRRWERSFSKSLKSIKLMSCLQTDNAMCNISVHNHRTFPVRKIEITAIGISRVDHAPPIYPQKLALTSPISDGCSVGIFHSRTKATELLLFSYESQNIK
jgi:hypothetical protein